MNTTNTVARNDEFMSPMDEELEKFKRLQDSGDKSRRCKTCKLKIHRNSPVDICTSCYVNAHGNQYQGT